MSMKIRTPPLSEPSTIKKFLAKPSWFNWAEELDAGWPGPDGSSCSLDDIQGVRIGITSRSYRHADLAANRHDWYYRLGRRFRLGHKFRKAADAWYRDRCIEQINETIIGFSRRMGVARAHARYYGLRVGGWIAWRKPAQRSV